MSIRAAVFHTTTKAHQAVNALKQAGFSNDEISVICSDEAKSKHFTELADEGTVGEKANKAMDIAGLSLLGLGGAAVLATLLTGGAAIFVIGAFSGIAAGGTFAALMASRGLGSEATDYYEQAVQRGDLLVTAHVEGDHAANRDLTRPLASSTRPAANRSNSQMVNYNRRRLPCLGILLLTIRRWTANWSPACWRQPDWSISSCANGKEAIERLETPPLPDVDRLRSADARDGRSRTGRGDQGRVSLYPSHLAYGQRE